MSQILFYCVSIKWSYLPPPTWCERRIFPTIQRIGVTQPEFRRMDLSHRITHVIFWICPEIQRMSVPVLKLEEWMTPTIQPVSSSGFVLQIREWVFLMTVLSRKYEAYISYILRNLHLPLICTWNMIIDCWLGAVKLSFLFCSCDQARLVLPSSFPHAINLIYHGISRGHTSLYLCGPIHARAFFVRYIRHPRWQAFRLV